MSMMSLAQTLQAQGRGGDTILAHITPEEARLLESRGGSGSTNPVTGLPEFGFFSDLWNGFKKLVRAVAPIIIPAIAIFQPQLIPMIGTALGASAAIAPIIGAAALSAGVTLASGGDLKQVLTSAALAGVTTYLTPILGKALTPTGTGQLGQVLAGSAATSAGITAIRGGTVKEMLAAAATGAASAYVGNIARDAVAKINNMLQSGAIARASEKPVTDAVFLASDAAQLQAAGLSEKQIADTLKATGADHIAAEYAANRAVAGMAPDTIAANLAANRTTGLYSGAANTRSITAGNNAEIVQRIEDALFAAADARGLADQGLSQADIKQNLMASGMSESSANSLANNAVRGVSADQMAHNLTNAQGYLSGGRLYTNIDAAVDRSIGQVMTDTQRVEYLSQPYENLINSGNMTAEQAAVLSDSGVTVKQAQDLARIGYTGADVVNLVAAGVDPTSLVRLGNTSFSESNINRYLQAGASVNDIATASGLVTANRLTQDTAEKLLLRDFSGSTINAIGNNSRITPDMAANIANSNLSAGTVDRLLSGGWDIKAMTNLAASGTDVNDLVTRNQWDQLRTLTAAPTKPTQPTTPVAPTAPTDPYQALINSGTVSASDAGVLRANGYTAAQVTNLTGLGYSGADLVDMASTGVPAATLQSLANTRFAESTINDLFQAGASANDISTASNLVNANRISLATAETALRRDFSGSTIAAIANSRGATPDTVAQVVNSNLSAATIDRLTSGGWDLNTATRLAGSGTDVNDLVTRNQWDTYRGLAQPTTTAQPTQPTQPTAPTAPVDPYQDLIRTGAVSSTDAAVLKANGYTAANVTALTQAGYTTADLVDMASTGVPASTLTSLANTQFAESAINDLFRAGASANDISTASNLVNANKIYLDTAEQLLMRDLNSSQITAVANRGAAVADLLARSDFSNTAITNLATNTNIDINRAFALADSGVDVNRLLTEGRTTELATQIRNTPMVRDEIGNFRVTSMADLNQEFTAQQSGQRVQDLKFISQDAANLARQGLSQTQIQQLLIADGASSTAASYAAAAAGRGLDATGIERELLGYGRLAIYPEATSTQFATANSADNQLLTGNVSDAAFVAADARQLADQGLSRDQISQLLQSSGVNAGVANYAATYAAQGTSETSITNMIARAYGTQDIYSADTVLASNQRYAPPGTTAVEMSNGSYGYRDTSGNILDVNGNITVRAPYQITSTGNYDAAPGYVFQGPNGPEIVLNSGKTVLLSDYQAAIDSGQPVSVDGMMNTQFRVEIQGGFPKYAGQTGAGTAPPGYRVANPEDVFGPDDSRNAQNPYRTGTYLDRETNTWFTPEDIPPAPPVVEAPVDPYVPIVIDPVTPTNPVQNPPVDLVPGTPGTSSPVTTYNPDTGMYETVIPGTGTNPVAEVVISPTPPTEPVVPTPPVVTPPTEPVVTPPGPVVPTPPVVTPPTEPVVTPPTEPVVTPPTEPVVPGWLPPGSVPYGTTNSGVPTFVTPDGSIYTGTGDYVGSTTPTTPVVTPPTEPVVTPPGPVVPTEPVVTPPGPVVTLPGDGTGGPGTGPVTPVVPVEPPVVEPPVVEPPVVEPPVVEPPVVEPPVVEPPVVEPPVVPPVVEPPYIPVPPPIVPPEEPEFPGWGPVDPLPFRKLPALALPGLNPGFIAPPTYYNTTSPVQSRYYYGPRPYQPGPTFDPQLYNTVPAPAQAWGLQQMYTPINLDQYLQTFAPGPVAPIQR
jgi:hypothetical protein